MSNKVNLLYCSSDMYAPFCGISMTSLFMNNQNLKFDIHVLDSGISKKNKEKLKKLCTNNNCNIEFLSVDPIIKLVEKYKLPKYNNNYIGYYKVFAIDVYFKNFKDRLIYIDSDTIIDGSIKELVDIDIKNNPLAMIEDSGMIFKCYKKNLGMNLKSTYYNSGGLIIFNPCEWRKNNWTMKIVNHLQKVRSEYSLVEQDIINVVFEGNIFTLDKKYNYMAHINMPKLNDVVVYHMTDMFTGRPWNKNNKHPFKDKYEYYKQLSLWKNEEQIEYNPTFLIKIQMVIKSVLPKCISYPILKIFMRIYFTFCVKKGDK